MNRRTAALGLLALATLAPLAAFVKAAPVPRVGAFAAYAGPSTWGPWVTVGSHLGSVTYNISAEPVGDTVLRCRVRYFNTAGQQVVSEWREDVSITTGNSVANVEVSFMGVPTGSAVHGTVSP